MKNKQNPTILEMLRKNKTGRFNNLKTNLFLRLLVIFYSIKKHSLLLGKTIGYKFLKEIRTSKLPYSIKLMMIKTHVSSLTKLNTVKSNGLIVKDKFVLDIDRMKKLIKYIDEVHNTPYFNRLKDSDNLFGKDVFLIGGNLDKKESPKTDLNIIKASDERIKSIISDIPKTSKPSNKFLSDESPLFEINRPVVFENRAFRQAEPIATKEKLQKLVSKSKFDYIMSYLDKCCKQEPSKGRTPLSEDFEKFEKGSVIVDDNGELVNK